MTAVTPESPAQKLALAWGAAAYRLAELEGLLQLERFRALVLREQLAAQREEIVLLTAQNAALRQLAGAAEARFWH